ncbi:unnamed protein product (macronuclear) [Paramecium tetraurelia]|uniref:EF-hand domain-containing protein n=1 Tax=Paramecium tetraurelia TaxID=5888 RepID=A0E3Q4_PARTE|nr:uncharacterized protein GSPATT00023094001 [Paramecium tetraurelia]CAK89921.1 unnamed protein product [Paramecium tetraurelia]|eukprot:XP_001457318.1 hypothetical protein (macronuclear) [Paramecium tetraurelia strain d4-2]
MTINSRYSSRKKNKKETIRQASTINPIQQMNSIDQLTGRSSSKLTSSMLIVKQERRNTASPTKIMRILSLCQDENMQQLADVLGEISRIELETDLKQKSQTLLLRNIRINKQQFIKFLERTYPIIICQQIAKAFKVPQVMSVQEYKQMIEKLENLDLKSQIRLCFLIYDYNNQGYITTHDLVEILKYNNNQAVEKDLLHMIKSTKTQISNQINNDIQQNHPLVLPTSLLRVKLDRSVIINQRRQSIISYDGRGRCISRISQKNSPDLSVELDQDNIQQTKNTTAMKKVLLITQIHKMESNTNSTNNLIQGLKNYKAEDQKKKNKTVKDENKISTDLSGFINIWFPNKPNIFYDIIRTLTEKS